ncbi:hypothetical protein [Streptomyces sp. NPDC051183]|uniref:hypothetical protein n=1 Tax=unclassified Streptomyces TaxID=2593676 RepID=UPI0034152833
MGGWEQAEGVRHRRTAARRAVLPGAFGVLLLAAVFLATGLLCARPGAAPAEDRFAVLDAHAAHDPHGTHAFCASPYDLPGCGPHAHATPGVLPVPPPAVAVAGTGPVPAARPAHTGRGRPPGTLARAPDLYALQVLRT